MRALIVALVLGCTMLITPLALADSPPEPDPTDAGVQEDAGKLLRRPHRVPHPHARFYEYLR